MGAFQGEGRAAVVVELRGLPARGIVATGAVENLLARGKLTGVRIGVAARALLGRGAVIDIAQSPLKVGGAMTINAFDAAVGAEERKARGGVVEASEALPSSRGVAGFATGYGAVGAASLHSLAKFAVVRIGVTGCAGTILKAVLDGLH